MMGMDPMSLLSAGAPMRFPCLLGQVLIGCLLSIPAGAQISNQVSYYEVEIWGPWIDAVAGNESRTGYGSLDWSNPNDIRGELCLGPGKRGAGPLKVSLRVTNPRDGVLYLTIPPASGLSFAA